MLSPWIPRKLADEVRKGLVFAGKLITLSLSQLPGRVNRRCKFLPEAAAGTLWRADIIRE
jgi:hypothetical protein